MTQSREHFYESGRWRWWDHFQQDLRFALRLMAKSPVLTAAIVVTLALGIGANSVVFSVVQAVVLRPLAYEEPDRIVQAWESGLRSGGEGDWVSFPNFRDWQRENRVFEEMAAYRYALLTMTGAEGAESVLGLEATDRLFAVLGVDPMLGRTFLPGEDEPGEAPVAVISYALWSRRFGGNPAIVGKSVNISSAAASRLEIIQRPSRFGRLAVQLPAVHFPKPGSAPAPPRRWPEPQPARSDPKPCAA